MSLSQDEKEDANQIPTIGEVSNIQEGPDARELLCHSDCTVDQLLQCNNVFLLLKSSDVHLITFLQQERCILRIFELIKEKDRLFIQERILPLFQSGPPVLYRSIAESIIIAEHAAKIFQVARSSFSAGVISRFFLKAFSMWPEDMSEIFRLSTTLYTSIIHHLDMLCLFNSVQSLVSSAHPTIWFLMWFCFKTITHDCPDYQLTQRIIPKTKFVPVDFELLTDVHIRNIYFLMKLFFQLKKTGEEEFAANVTRFFNKCPTLSVPQLKLALLLKPPDNNLLRKCLQMIDDKRKEHCYSSEDFCLCLQYITLDLDFVGYSNLITCLFLVLCNHNVSDFARHVSKQILIDMLNHDFGQDSIRISHDIQQIIAYSMNHFEEDQNLFPFIMAFASVVSNHAEFPKWEEFLLAVVIPWTNDGDEDERMVVNEEFKFDENDLPNPDHYIINIPT